MQDQSLRSLPSVERLLQELRAHGAELPHAEALAAARDTLETARAAILGGGSPPSLAELVAGALASAARSSIPSLRPVINASGVLLQTNLGRAPLSEDALDAMRDVACGYSNLEFDLDAGTRGGRHEHVRELIRRTTGAEDGLVVNNNAAALFMVLQVFARGSEVIVSRGHAVEIGGGFRIPDVLRQSGATLVEVGTTNRTYTRDYAAARSPLTAAILRVHASNFRVIGFTAEAPLAELAEVAHETGALLIDDLGSGCLVDTTAYGMAREPTVQESVRAGADLALFSGDKLLGGPQCGVIAGRAELVAELRRHPLARALRVDKLTIAALNATLRAYAIGEERIRIPLWRMLALPLDALHARAARWAAVARDRGRVVESRTMVGGGSLPGEGVPSWSAAFPGEGAAAVAARLRAADPPVVPRVADGAVLLDPRTVDAADDGRVEAALRLALT